MKEPFVRRTFIDKGWSSDKKYQVQNARGESFLLRILPEDRGEKAESLFRILQRVSALDIPMCQPVEAGRSGEGPYLLLSWIEGRDAEEAVPQLSEAQQYAYGIEAGRIVRKIHSIPAPEGLESWETRYQRKIDRKLQGYARCPLKYEKGDLFVDYIQQNREHLQDRPQSFQHGDYHIGNMMIDTNGQLVIIDFDRYDYGDPWEEFNRIVWSAQASPLFASGMVDGYFGSEVPLAFWRLLVLYIAANTLSSLPWAIPFGEGEIETMRTQAAEVLSWYDDLQTVIPGWYTHCP